MARELSRPTGRATSGQERFLSARGLPQKKSINTGTSIGPRIAPPQTERTAGTPVRRREKLPSSPPTGRPANPRPTQGRARGAWRERGCLAGRFLDRPAGSGRPVSGSFGGLNGGRTCRSRIVPTEPNSPPHAGNNSAGGVTAGLAGCGRSTGRRTHRSAGWRGPAARTAKSLPARPNLCQRTCPT
jgi:hypothetical protein